MALLALPVGRRFGGQSMMDGTRPSGSAPLSSVELCAGAGGQALGLERAGFQHDALVEAEPRCRETLSLNRPAWPVLEEDQANIRSFAATAYRGVDLLAGGLPCPPFSKAGKQLGAKDDRNLFPDMLRVVDECRPRAIMLENVRGFLDAAFEPFRNKLRRDLKRLGYVTDWRLLNASDYGVSQLRPRVVIIALRSEDTDNFAWPAPIPGAQPVGALLQDLMAENGWPGANAWADQANAIAPTLVGGSLKHGGPDLGPTRARAAWAKLGVDGKSLANEAPAPDFVGMPKLTVRMVARLQGFPDTWQFAGRKTPAYRQVGNAFPPPVAHAVGAELAKVLTHVTVKA